MQDSWRLLSTLLVVGIIFGTRTYFARRGHKQATDLLREATEALARGDHATARKQVETCVKRYPSQPGIRRLYARVLAQSGDVARAEEELNMAVALEPRVPEHQVDLGLFFLRHGKEQKGLELLKTIFAQHPALREQLRAQPALAEVLTPSQLAQLFDA